MWFFLSLGAAFGAGTADALVKKASPHRHPITLSLIRAGWGSLFLLPFFFFAAPPASPKDFWINLALALPLEVIASLMFHTGLKISPLSLSVPYMAFTPVFLLGLGWAFLGEVPTAAGVSGVALVTAGAFWLQIVSSHSPEERTAAGRFRVEKGSLLVLGAAFLYAFTSILAKRALAASSPFYFCSLYYPCVLVALLPFQFRSDNKWGDIVSRPKLFALIGLMEAAVFICQFEAFERVEVAYVIAIKRLSLLLSVFYGRYLFDEFGLKSRLAGAALMVAGAILIALA